MEMAGELIEELKLAKGFDVPYYRLEAQK